MIHELQESTCAMLARLTQKLLMGLDGVKIGLDNGLYR